MGSFKDLFDNSIVGKRIGSLYVYNKYIGSDKAICYCTNCNRSNIEIPISKLKYWLNQNRNVTCGCKLDNQDIEEYLYKIGDSESKLTIVKKLPKKQYECLCECGNLVTVDEEQLENGTMTQCLDCMSNNVIEYDKLYSQKRRKELYYIWHSYLYLYSNPTKDFKYKIIDKNIKFFPEFNNNFELFYNWALNTNYRKEGMIYLERKDTEQDFTSDNCIWKDEDKSKLIDLPKSILKNSTDEKGELTRQMSEFGKIENSKEVRESRDKLFNYCYTHYGIKYIPKSIQETLKQLNNGTSKTYGNIQISYDQMYDMLIYYQDDLFSLYKSNKSKGKLSSSNQRMAYDIAIIVDRLDDYENRKEIKYNEANHNFETVEDLSIYLNYNAPRKNTKDKKKMEEIDKMVDELTKDLFDE